MVRLKDEEFFQIRIIRIPTPTFFDRILNFLDNNLTTILNWKLNFNIFKITDRTAVESNMRKHFLKLFTVRFQLLADEWISWEKELVIGVCTSSINNRENKQPSFNFGSCSSDNSTCCDVDFVPSKYPRSNKYMGKEGKKLEIKPTWKRTNMIHLRGNDRFVVERENFVNK